MPDSKINLLIVDDEEQFLESISKSLTGAGFQCDCRQSGRESN